jgi:N-acetylglucosaminyl-diphospho-decaprenol L-rhamnosyltransferase
MDVSIIVVTHNTRDMTLECISSVIEQTKTLHYELIVFDSGSKDGSVEAIRSRFPDLRLIASPEDVGFATANNIAAKHTRGRRLLLLNPDTIVLNNAIERLNEFAVSTPNSRIWGGRTVYANGSLNPSCWRHSTLWSVFCLALGLSAIKRGSFFSAEGYGRWQGDTVRSVDIIAGCFFLIDRDLWVELGGFDPIFFMFGEEADLCLRARQFGGKPMFTPTATIIHYGGASYPDKAEQLIQTLAARVTLMQRHWSTLSCFIGTKLAYMVPLLRWIIYGVAALTLGRSTYRKNAHVWGEVWRNRQYWIEGWTDAAVRFAREGFRQKTAQ